MSVRIASIACAAPAGSIAQAEAQRMAASRCAGSETQQRTLGRIYRGSRIERRGSVLIETNGRGTGPDAFFPPPASAQDRGPTTGARMERYARAATPLALAAARGALAQASLGARAVEHVVTASCTGFCAPGVDIALVRELGLNAGVSRTHVGFMGCHAALNALRVASSLASGSAPGPALVVCVEACTLHFQYGWTRDRVVANALFADGAGAAVVTPHDAAGRFGVRDTRSRLLVDDASLMGWTIGDHGFEMTLSSRVPGALRDTLGTWVSGWLCEHGLRAKDIAGWAVHPGGPRILDAVEAALGVGSGAMDASRAVLAEHGNMSSATLLFILDRLRPGPGEHVVAMAFGPGLACEAALLVGV